MNRITIPKKDLKILLFWAHAGTLYSIGGSHSKTIPKLIVKYAKRLGLTPSNFCCFNCPELDKLASDVLEEWNQC